jgi:putative component of membrane protein insertase Oxa1/YidC/SpoIIIJ protein YidD
MNYSFLEYLTMLFKLQRLYSVKWDIKVTVMLIGQDLKWGGHDLFQGTMSVWPHEAEKTHTSKADSNKVPPEYKPTDTITLTCFMHTYNIVTTTANVLHSIIICIFRLTKCKQRAWYGYAIVLTMKELNKNKQTELWNWNRGAGIICWHMTFSKYIIDS